ncbi:hypothetical protein N8644_01625 [bacterium]|nr:hypothetical protein [bacterium]
MKKNIVQNTIALLLLTLFVGCGAKDITKRQAVDHLSKSGLDGNASDELLYQIIGADDGFKWRGTDFSIEAYKFSSPDKISLQCNYINGNWGVRIYRDKTSIEIENNIINALDELFGKKGEVLILDENKRNQQIAKSAEAKNREKCANNIKEISLALRQYATDNQDRFPWQVATVEGGVANTIFPISSSDPDGFNDLNGKSVFSDSFSISKALSKYLNDTEILFCPSDKNALKAVSFETLKQLNVSYKFGMLADESKPNNIMCLCNHHADDPKNEQWILSLSDCSVQRASTARMWQYWVDQQNKNFAPLKKSDFFRRN